MTITEEILIAANKLANAGKKPTVALIKANLCQSAPLPLIISTLKGWLHQPEFISVARKGDEANPQHSTDEMKSDLRQNDVVKVLIQEIFAEELKQVKLDLSDIKQLIEELSKQIKAVNKN